MQSSKWTIKLYDSNIAKESREATFSRVVYTVEYGKCSSCMTTTNFFVTDIIQHTHLCTHTIVSTPVNEEALVD